MLKISLGIIKLLGIIIKRSFTSDICQVIHTTEITPNRIGVECRAIFVFILNK